MVLLSFNYFEKELKARTKDQTMRPYTPARFRQLSNAELLQCWWKSRTTDGYKLYDAIPKEPPFIVKFICVLGPGGSRASFMVTKVIHRQGVGILPYIPCDTPGEIEYFTEEQAHDLAIRDGFKDLTAMLFHLIHHYEAAKVFQDPWIVTRFAAL